MIRHGWLLLFSLLRALRTAAEELPIQGVQSEVKIECTRCFWGVIPYWSVAVSVSLLSSFLTVGGFVLQKKAVQDPSAKLWPRLGDVVFSPQWVLGFFLAVVVPLPGNITAYALAPMSLIAPLSGFTIMVNFVMAPWLLGERLQAHPDISAGVLILIGMVLTTATGDRGEKSAAMTTVIIWDNCVQAGFIFGCFILVVIMVCTAGCMYLWRVEIEEAARAHPLNPPIRHFMLPAIMYASFGCVTNVSLKAVSGLLAAGMNPVICGFLGIFVVFPIAWCQLNFLNRGLRLYLQVIFFPVSSAALLISNTVFGALYYQEYNVFAGAPDRLATFCLGVLLIVTGINLFRLRKGGAQVEVDVESLEDCPKAFPSEDILEEIKLRAKVLAPGGLSAEGTEDALAEASTEVAGDQEIVRVSV